MTTYVGKPGMHWVNDSWNSMKRLLNDRNRASTIGVNNKNKVRLFPRCHLFQVPSSPLTSAFNKSKLQWSIQYSIKLPVDYTTRPVSNIGLIYTPVPTDPEAHQDQSSSVLVYFVIANAFVFQWSRDRTTIQFDPMALGSRSIASSVSDASIHANQAKRKGQPEHPTSDA